MNINLTLVGQMITFAIFVWFTMKYIWPPVIQAMSERQKKVAEGLAAAERGHHELELAQKKIKVQLKEAKEHANDILENANKRATQLLEETKQKAREESQKMLEIARAEIQGEVLKARIDLKNQIANLIVQGTESVLSKGINESSNRQLIEEWIKEIK